MTSCTTRAVSACLLAVIVFVAACGGDDDEAASGATDGSDSTTTVAPHGDADDTTAALDADAPDLGRVVGLAEEFLLADLLTLGIEPVASSATVVSAGLQGLDDFDTSAIEVLPMTELNLEQLARQQPDTIITLQYWVDQIGAEVLEQIADVIVVPDGLYGIERLTEMGELVGRPEHAAAAIDEYERALAGARERIGEACQVSLAAIYGGPSVAAFVDGPWDIPSAIQAAGCALEPDVDDAEPDRNGRAWLSLEQLGLLSSDTLVLLQTDTVEGESSSVAEVEASPLWSTLPAVENDDVVTFDRLGYPGIDGTIRFLGEFADAMA